MRAYYFIDHLSGYQFSSAQFLSAGLANANCPDDLPQELLQRIANGLSEIFDRYEHDHPFIYTTASEIAHAYLEATIAYLNWLLPFMGDSPFTKSVRELPDMAHAIFEITKPFNTDLLTRRNFGLYPHFLDNVRRESTKLGKTTLVFPQDHPDQHDLARRYLAGTPLYQLFDIDVPLAMFSELNRCAHHWCLGKTRRGKTTFLRHIIKYDLDDVAKEQCSLVVLDSKDKGLVHEMRTLKAFAPGQSCDGRLIVIDSDQPFPLNPFTIKDKGLARSIITYMVATEGSPTQIGALNHFVDAVLQSRDKSLATLIKYIRMGDKEAPAELKSFDADLQDWWRTTRLGLFKPTVSSVEQRLTNFMREHRGSPILQNLNADSWGLDLYGELHNGGKVLLVDADISKNGPVGTALMGRLFIALIESLAARRQKATKPIWVVVDEASDYLSKNDPSFVQILVKAAGAKVGMTVAHQYRGQLDLKIEEALENAEIQSVCPQRGRVELTVEERPLTLNVDPFEFEREPQMDRIEYAQMRAELANAYPYKKPLTVSEQIAPRSLTQKF